VPAVHAWSFPQSNRSRPRCGHFGYTVCIQRSTNRARAHRSGRGGRAGWIVGSGGARRAAVSKTAQSLFEGIEGTLESVRLRAR
jgi:hypothetical protein